MKQSLISLLLLVLLLSCNKEKKTQWQDFTTQGTYIYLPVFIENNQYSFLFDTGCTNTWLGEDTCEELGLETVPLDSIFYFKLEKYGARRGILYPKEIRIGNKKIKNKMNVLPREYEDQGIVGFDIIGKHNWFFDFKDKKYLLLDKSSEWTPDTIWRKKIKHGYYLKEAETPYIQASLSPFNKREYLFDTGLRISRGINYKEHTDSICAVALHYLDKNQPNLLLMEAEEKQVAGSMSLNLRQNEQLFLLAESSFDSISLPPMAVAMFYKETDYFELLKKTRKMEKHEINIITSAYMHYFDGLFINSREKTISFYYKQELSDEKKEKNDLKIQMTESVKKLYDDQFEKFINEEKAKGVHSSCKNCCK